MEPPCPLPANSIRPEGPHLLHVNDVGTILLLVQQEILVGGVGEGRACDVKLRTDGIGTPISIRRADDRYLTRSASPFLVNGEATCSKLLFSGDTMEFGSRGRLRFSRPVAASASAVFTPTSAGLAATDVRHVVMLADSLVFGAYGAHFGLPDCDTRLILSYLDGAYAVRRLRENGERRDARWKPDSFTERSPDRIVFDTVPILPNQPTVVDGVHFLIRNPK